MHENDEYDDDHDKMTLMMLAILKVLVNAMGDNKRLSDYDKNKKPTGPLQAVPPVPALSGSTPSSRFPSE